VEKEVEISIVSEQSITGVKRKAGAASSAANLEAFSFHTKVTVEV